MHRREFLVTPVITTLALSAPDVRASSPHPSPVNSLGVKALVFDTFGTVVDWRGSIMQEGEQWGRENNLQIDWGKFADRWRAGYGPAFDFGGRVIATRYLELLDSGADARNK